MPNNKAPGIDGLPIEVFKTFWSRLGPLYFDYIQMAIKKETLNFDARRGIITQIPKKGRDILLVPNWRPINLLTCDYKILAKALACRMNSVAIHYPS